MLELLSPRKIQDSPYRKRLAEAQIRGGWNYVLDHAWLFEKIDHYIKSKPPFTPIVLDIGCGNSMLHTFLEEELHLGIIGIDRIFGHCPYNERDKRMDLCIDFSKDNSFFKGSADIVYWCSAIEHNAIEDQKRCVQASFEALKPGGLFLATFGYSKTTHYFAPSEQFNVDARQAEEVYGVKWIHEPNFDKMVEEYRQNILDIDMRHTQRYKTTEYNFVVGAVSAVK